MSRFLRKRIYSVCKKNPGSVAWQPFGSGESQKTFTLLDSHDRRFPAIALCDACKTKCEQGQGLLFTYRKQRYQVVGDHIRACKTFSDGIFFTRRVADEVADEWLRSDHPDWHGGVEAAREIEKRLRVAIHSLEGGKQ